MNIAFIIPSLEKSGPGIVVNDLYNELIKMGHHCGVFYFDTKQGLHFSGETTQIKKGNEINFSEWDIIHSHGFRADRFIYQKFKNRSFPNCKLISTLHQPITPNELAKTYNIPKSIIGSILWHRSLKIHDKIVVLNDDTYRKLPKNLHNKAKVIFNGRSIKIDEISSEERNLFKILKSKYTIIGTCSSITKRKGLEQIVKALPNLPGYALVAIGEGDQKIKLEYLARKLNVSERCIFLGYRNNSTDYLPYFDIFIMCTRSEGFPLALIEAASQGIPTILSDIPILKAIVDEKKVDFYHIDDIQSLVNAIRNCDINKGPILKSFYLDKLTAKAMAERYFLTYESLLRKGGCIPQEEP